MFKQIQFRPDMSSRSDLHWRQLLLWHAYGCVFGVLLTAYWTTDTDHGLGYLKATAVAAIGFGMLSPVLLAVLALWNTLALTWLRSIETSNLLRVLGLVFVATGLPFLLWFSLIVWGGAVGDVSSVPDRFLYVMYFSISLSWLLVPRLLVPRLRKSLLS